MPPYACPGTVADDRWRLARPIRWGTARYQTVADGGWICPAAIGTLVARAFVYPSGIPRLPSAVLYGHYAYSQGHPCRNSTLHVPQLFLHLGLLEEMKAHALDMAEAIQRNDFKSFGTLVGKTWMQKKALDSGTNPPAVEDIICQIKDYTLGYNCREPVGEVICIWWLRIRRQPCASVRP